MRKKLKIFLCQKGELSLDDCGETTIKQEDGNGLALFFIQHENDVSCYINSCPHTGASLNWNPGVFLDTNKLYIQCSLHGALFEKGSGRCVFGPCIGQSLRKVETILENNQWFADLTSCEEPIPDSD